MRSLLKSSVLLLAALAMGVANALFNPNTPAWSETELAEGEIRLADALLVDEVLWIDARSKSEYLEGSIPNAVLLNEDQWGNLLPEFLSVWQPEHAVVVYCSSQTCQASHSLADRLKGELGLEEVFVLKGGWEAWQAHHQ